jgi:hypothetical protein
MTALRDGLLDDRAIALAGGVPETVGERLVALGARVELLEAGIDEDRAGEWAGRVAPLHGLLHWGAATFGDGGSDGLGSSLEQAWVAIRGVATGALIPGGLGGKVVLVAPPPEAGPFAGAARAALENLARTLSVEWARYAITATAIAPAAGTTELELAELVCFLVSPAGDYFSGCAFELGCRF